MKSNKKIYTTLLIFATALLFLMVFFVWTLLREIKNNSSDLISAKNDIVALEAQAVETENFRTKYDAHRSNLEKIEQLFIDTDNPVEFIKYLEDLALVSKIDLSISSPSLSAGPKQSEQDFAIFQLIVNGGFSDVLNFSKKIETGSYLIEVTSLTIQNSQEAEKGVLKDYFARKVSATFTIKAFIKK